MGTSFFQRALMPWKGGVQGAVDSIDPVYQVTGKTAMDPVTFAGPNSWLSKESSYDPLIQSGAGKYINPAAVNAGQAYSNRNVVPSTPTPFAGSTPTLQDATNGYLQAAQQATAQKQQAPAVAGVQQQNPYGSYGW
jgi:hypothetical protein